MSFWDKLCLTICASELVVLNVGVWQILNAIKDLPR